MTPPNGVPIFNPLDHGIAGQPLMVPAHEYNRLLGVLCKIAEATPSPTTGMVHVSDRFMREIRDAIERRDA